LIAAYIKVAHDFQLPFLALKPPDAHAPVLSLLASTDIILDAIVIAGPGLRPDETTDFYLNAIKHLSRD
jgi:hypothetical protein